MEHQVFNMKIFFILLYLDLPLIAMFTKIKLISKRGLKSSLQEIHCKKTSTLSLLEKWECISHPTQTNSFNISSAIMWKECESIKTWGSDKYIRAEATRGILSSKWMGIPYAKKVSKEKCMKMYS